MASERRKCLNILELQEGALEEDIRKAYKRLALKYHPDKNDSDDAKGKFQEIGYAYKYLTEGASAFSASDPFNMREDFVIRIFEEMFYGRFRGYGGFPFFCDESDEEDFFTYESDDDDDNCSCGSFHQHYSCAHGGHGQTYANRYPRPNRTGHPFKQPTKKQLRKQQKRMKQKQRQKENKQEGRANRQWREQQRYHYSDDINPQQKREVPKTSEKSAEQRRQPSPVPETTQQNHCGNSRPVTPLQNHQPQQSTKKQKKKEMSEQHKRQKEMEEIAAELKLKLEREKQKQLEKEKLEAQKKAAENESGISFDYMFDNAKKSKRARQRENKRQDSENLTNSRADSVSRSTVGFSHPQQQWNNSNSNHGNQRRGSTSSGNFSVGNITRNRFSVLDDFDSGPRSASFSSSASHDSVFDSKIPDHQQSSGPVPKGSTEIQQGTSAESTDSTQLESKVGFKSNNFSQQGASFLPEKNNNTTSNKADFVLKNSINKNQVKNKPFDFGQPVNDHCINNSNGVQSKSVKIGHSSGVYTFQDRNYQTRDQSRVQSNNYYSAKTFYNSRDSKAGSAYQGGLTGIKIDSTFEKDDNKNIPKDKPREPNNGQKPDLTFGFGDFDCGDRKKLDLQFGDFDGRDRQKPDLQFGYNDIVSNDGGIKNSEVKKTPRKKTTNDGLNKHGQHTNAVDDNTYSNKSASDSQTTDSTEFEVEHQFVKDWSEQNNEEEVEFGKEDAPTWSQQSQSHFPQGNNKSSHDNNQYHGGFSSDFSYPRKEQLRPKAREFIPGTRGYQNHRVQSFERPGRFPYSARGPAPPVFSGRGMHWPPCSFPPPGSQAGYSRHPPSIWGAYLHEPPPFQGDDRPPITRFSEKGYSAPKVSPSKKKPNSKGTGGFVKASFPQKMNMSDSDKISKAYPADKVGKPGDANLKTVKNNEQKYINVNNPTYGIDEYLIHSDFKSNNSQCKTSQSGSDKLTSNEKTRQTGSDKLTSNEKTSQSSSDKLTSNENICSSAESNQMTNENQHSHDSSFSLNSGDLLSSCHPRKKVEGNSKGLLDSLTSNQGCLKDSLDSLDDFDLYGDRSYFDGNSTSYISDSPTDPLYVDMGLDEFLSRDNLGVPASMFSDNIKNYYK